MAAEKSTDVVVVGELNVDLIMNGLRQFPMLGKEVLADQMTLTMGSSSAIFASNLCALGTGVSFVGRLGTDSFGDHIFTSLSRRGVITDRIVRSAEHPTGATIILNVGEDRAMVTNPGAMNFLTLADVSDDALTTARHLHLSSVFLQPGLFHDLTSLFRKAKALGLSTSIDPQWDPSEQWKLPLAELLPHVDVFMPNMQELNAMTKTDDLKAGLEVLKPYANVVVVKNGSNGAFLWENNSVIHQPSFLNNAVVDSIGAGDSFDSGFIHQFLRGKPKYECLEFGALTGAINTTRAGGTTAFESVELIKSIAKTNFNYTF